MVIDRQLTVIVYIFVWYDMKHRWKGGTVFCTRMNEERSSHRYRSWRAKLFMNEMTWSDVKAVSAAAWKPRIYLSGRRSVGLAKIQEMLWCCGSGFVRLRKRTRIERGIDEWTMNEWSGFARVHYNSYVGKKHGVRCFIEKSILTTTATDWGL